MNVNRLVLPALLSCALASPAAAQFHDVAFTVEHGQGWSRVDATVAVSPSRVVVATNHRLELRNRSDGLLRPGQGHDVGSASFPFVVSPAGGDWRDPRADYDPANGRLWVIYWDGSANIHVAVSVDSSPDTWDEWDEVSQTGDWYYFTGSEAIDLGDEDILPATWRLTTADHPIINIDDDFLYISAHDTVGFIEPVDRGAVASVPLSHTGGSMLGGAKPDESDIEVLQPSLLPEPFEDNGILRYPVQEPHEQFTPAQFFICTSQGPAYGVSPLEPPLFYDGVQTQIRLAARYFDSGAGVWRWIFRDMDIDSVSPSPDHFFNTAAEFPDTPKSGWEPHPSYSKFNSAVLARNVGGAWRLFAGHHVVTSSLQGAPVTPIDKTEFRYYVIDPDIAGFPGSWTPSIEVVGRAPSGNITGAQTYQGAIGVNVNGQATITFTRSGTQSPAGWPSLARARLTAGYTAIQYEISTAFAQGPKAWYADPSGDPDDDLGGDYADMQADPFHCGQWAIGTIVDDPGDHEAPVPHTWRAIWLTEIDDPCSNNAEMNGDGVVNEADWLLYQDHYAKGTPQADMDGDGAVDLLDHVTYTDEYAKRPR